MLIENETRRAIAPEERYVTGSKLMVWADNILRWDISSIMLQNSNSLNKEAFPAPAVPYVDRKRNKSSQSSRGALCDRFKINGLG